MIDDILNQAIRSGDPKALIYSIRLGDPQSKAQFQESIPPLSNISYFLEVTPTQFQIWYNFINSVIPLISYTPPPYAQWKCYHSTHYSRTCLSEGNLCMERSSDHAGHNISFPRLKFLPTPIVQVLKQCEPLWAAQEYTP